MQAHSTKGSSTLKMKVKISPESTVLDQYSDLIANLGSAIADSRYVSSEVKLLLKNSYCSLMSVSREEIREINKENRDIDKETDVLSFPTKDFGDYFCYDEETVVLGDIVISTQTALKQFNVYGSSCFEEEIARLIIHGMLHLLGYDHEKGFLCCKIMENKEKILNKIVKYKFKFERVKDYEK